MQNEDISTGKNRRAPKSFQLEGFRLPLLEWIDIDAGEVRMPIDGNNPGIGPYKWRAVNFSGQGTCKVSKNP